MLLLQYMLGREIQEKVEWILILGHGVPLNHSKLLLCCVTIILLLFEWLFEMRSKMSRYRFPVVIFNYSTLQFYGFMHHHQPMLNGMQKDSLSPSAMFHRSSPVRKSCPEWLIWYCFTCFNFRRISFNPIIASGKIGWMIGLHVCI